MNIQYEKALRAARTLFVLIFTLFASVALVEGQRRKPQTKSVRLREAAQSPKETISTIETLLPELVRRIKPSVVLVRVFDKEGKAVKAGSAFFIAPTRVVTNYHVVEGGSSAEIYSNEGFAYKVSRMLSYDPKADLAVLEIELPAGVQFKGLTIARGAVQEGESIVVIGNPAGLQGTVSQGIVSAFRQYSIEQPLIQITAPISLGSSGSPVVNMRGEVVGIAVLIKADGQNLNFAVAASKLAGVSETAERWSGITRLYEDGARLYRGGNYGRALEMFARAVELYPAYAAAWMAIGRTQAALGDYAAAAAAFVETARLEPDNSAAHYSAGIIYAALGRNADAVASFRRVLSIEPNNADAYLEAGNAFYKLNDARSAADSFTKAINLRPDDTTAYYNLGLAYIAQGERKAARKLCKKLQEMGAAEIAGKLLQNIAR